MVDEVIDDRLYGAEVAQKRAKSRGAAAANRAREGGPKGLVPLTEDERVFVEDVAVVMEREGLPRMAGRIVARLLLAEPDHRSFQELRDELGASMGSISTMIRLLQQLNFVERVSVPGEGRARYRLRPHVWAARMEANTKKATQFRLLTERGLELLAGEPEEARERLVALKAAAAFWESELPAAAAELDRRRRARMDAVQGDAR